MPSTQSAACVFNKRGLSTAERLWMKVNPSEMLVEQGSVERSQTFSLFKNG